MRCLKWDMMKVLLGLLFTSITYAQMNIELSSIPSTLALSVNNPGLNTALIGNSRQVKIYNASETVARRVKVQLLHMPRGTSVSPLQCGDIKPHEACIISVTPGASSSKSNAAIQIKGDNTALLSIPIQVLTYGSIYQGGYVFAIEDGYTQAPMTGSVKGKVLSLQDQVPPTPGIIWSSNGHGGLRADVAFDALPQVFDSTLNHCNAKIDGACNTEVIVNYYSRPLQHVPIAHKYYAAGVCKQHTTDEQGRSPCQSEKCLQDWYLPAICEMDQVGALTPEGIVCPAAIQNIVANLDQLININCAGSGCLNGTYWSSTAHYNRGYPEYSAWDEDFNASGSSQYDDFKNNQYGVRCVRKF